MLMGVCVCVCMCVYMVPGNGLASYPGCIPALLGSLGPWPEQFKINLRITGIISRIIRIWMLLLNFVKKKNIWDFAHIAVIQVLLNILNTIVLLTIHAGRYVESWVYSYFAWARERLCTYSQKTISSGNIIAWKSLTAYFDRHIQLVKVFA